MFISKPIFHSLENLAQSFNHNYSYVVDFLFYIFDRLSYEEKKNILKICPLMKDEKKQVQTDQNKNLEPISEEIKIDINPLLEDRLVNLILECEKLQTVSDGIEFLFFVTNQIDKDELHDLIIQYSIESIQSGEFDYLGPTKPENYQNPDPFHVVPNIPDKTQFAL